jgi:DNA-directed RNA polymerase subunit K/omega
MLRSMPVMDDATESIEVHDDTAMPGSLPHVEPAPPIQSRFLFVDVAALRAKQLRRGARLRFAEADVIQLPKKAERLAMEEVRRGLVPYDVPAAKHQERTEDLA